MENRTYPPDLEQRISDIENDLRWLTGQIHSVFVAVVLTCVIQLVNMMLYLVGFPL
jgi:hypothetical protein